jgi:hypothetical protein
MPDDCPCVVTIKGAKTFMAKFYQTLSKPNVFGEEVNFSLYQAIPSEDNHESNIYNWGVKHDADFAEIITRTETEFVVKFVTPWVPPLEWVNNVATLYPRLCIRIAYVIWTEQIFGSYTVHYVKKIAKSIDLEFKDDEFSFTDGPLGRLKAFMNANHLL